MGDERSRVIELELIKTQVVINMTLIKMSFHSAEEGRDLEISFDSVLKRLLAKTKTVYSLGEQRELFIPFQII